MKLITEQLPDDYYESTKFDEHVELCYAEGQTVKEIPGESKMLITTIYIACGVHKEDNGYIFIDWLEGPYKEQTGIYNDENCPKIYKQMIN